jgi:hypothetical protein
VIDHQLSESRDIRGKRRRHSLNGSFTLTILVKSDTSLLFVGLAANYCGRSGLRDLPARCDYLAR